MTDPNVAVECEDFVQIVLDQEPDKPRLYYCLGMLNHRGKGDLEAARADFRRFIDAVDPERFKKQIEIAHKWVREIDTIIGTSEGAKADVTRTAHRSATLG